MDESTVQVLKVLFCCSILWPLYLVLAVPGSLLGSPWPLVFQGDSGHTHQIPQWESRAGTNVTLQ